MTWINSQNIHILLRIICVTPSIRTAILLSQTPKGHGYVQIRKISIGLAECPHRDAIVIINVVYDFILSYLTPQNFSFGFTLVLRPPCLWCLHRPAIRCYTFARVRTV